jgi:hypothetical protein
MLPNHFVQQKIAPMHLNPAKVTLKLLLELNVTFCTFLISVPNWFPKALC